MGKIKGIALTLLILGILAIPTIPAYTSANIYIDEDGSASFIGEASAPLEDVIGVGFKNGRITGITQQLTSKNADVWTFALNLNDSAELRIFLPENALLQVSSLDSNVEPLVGDYKNSVVLSLGGSNPYISFDYTISQPEDKNLFLIAVSIFSILLISLLLFFAARKKLKRKSENRKQKSKTRKKTRKIDVVKQTLNEREKIIVEKLLKLKEAKQSFLQKKTEIPKASFSRHIQNLQRKGVLEIEEKGRNNLIKLNREMLKKA